MAPHATEILAKLMSLGIEVTAANGKLRLRPKGMAPRDLVEAAKANRSGLVAEIERVRGGGTPLHNLQKSTDAGCGGSGGSEGGHTDEDYSALSAWAHAGDPSAVPLAPGISRIVVIPPVDPQRNVHVLAQVCLVFADRLILHGIQIIRVHENQVAIRYPSVTCGEVSTSLVRPTSKQAQDELDAMILAQARSRGYLLIEPAPEQEGADASTPTSLVEDVAP